MQKIRKFHQRNGQNKNLLSRREKKTLCAVKVYSLYP